MRTLSVRGSAPWGVDSGAPIRLIATGVVVRYPHTQRDVLAGADLSVATGETVAVLGPSGSGKSTLLSVLGGLVSPTDGTVGIEGLAPSRSDLRVVTSWILQTVNVLPERSVLDNVALAGLTRGFCPSDARRHAAERLAQVGLGSRLDDRVRVLSGGEIQRVVIARALASGRPFLLADEPTGQLDRSTSASVLEALFTSSHGAGVVVVTHDPTVAECCDRVVRIEDGVVLPA